VRFSSTPCCLVKHMWTWLQIADVLGCMLILAGLWNAPRNPKWWVVYCVGTIFFLYVVISKGLVGMTVMGLATFITGLKNSRKKVL
jgi:hypothetical protein